MKLKNKIITGALVVSMGCSLVACGSSEGNDAGGTTTGEKVFTYGTTGYGVGMLDAGTNPHNSYDGWSALRYGVGETLFKFSDSMEPEPWLAESYTFTDDTHVQIKLKENVNFSNGNKMDAAAVKACLDHLIATHDRAPSDMKIKEITTEGDYTIVIETTEPTPALINFLCDPYGCIIDMSVFNEEQVASDRLVIGTGPYVATYADDYTMELKKNENYWNGTPNMDKIVIKGFTDGTTMTNALQSGELDATYGLPYASYSLVENNSQYTVATTETSRQFFGKMNFNKPIMQDEAVRKAICMGIDKQGFVEALLGGHGAVSRGPFPASFDYGDSTVTAEEYNPEEAKKILEEAGWVDADGDGIREKDGQKLTINWLTYPGRIELPLLAESAQATLKEIGIDVQINNTENHKQYWKSGDYDIYVSAMVTSPTGDPEYFFNTHAITGAPSNYEGYSDSKLDELASKLHTTFDNTERGKIATEMSQILLDDHAYVFASHLKMAIVSKSNVTGIEPHPCDYYEITSELDFK